MALEIERKFRVVDDGWRSQVTRSVFTEQAYIAVTEACGVRVRIQGEGASINLKSAGLTIERTEYEYPVPVAEARDMLDRFCTSGHIVKTRHYVDFDGHSWEVDEFDGANAGLVIAEIELASADQTFARPPWLGPEVSGDKRFLNTYLAEHPYSTWPADGGAPMT